MRHREALGAAALTLCVLLCPACSSRPPTPLPDSWGASAADGTVSTIELRTNGTGTFTRVPVWTGIGTCANDNTAPYSGEVTWTAHDERFTVDADGKPLTLWADTGFMALDWSKLMVDVCGTEAHSTAFLPYDGSPATGLSRGSSQCENQTRGQTTCARPDIRVHNLGIVREFARWDPHGDNAIQPFEDSTRA